MSNVNVKINDIYCKLINSTAGTKGIDVSEILSAHKAKFFDPGFAMTASCESKITYIDGINGVLTHRGYDIQDIVDKKTFMQTIYLILYGTFPSQDELNLFRIKIGNIKPQVDLFKQISKTIPQNSHPMSVLMTLSSSFAAFQSNNEKKHENNIDKSIELIKNFLCMTCVTFCHAKGIEFEEKYNKVEDFDYTEYFIQNAQINVSQNKSLLTECLDKILILHIDHGQNASTSTTRMITSSNCDLYGAVTGAVASLWGFLHGGANEAVLDMLKKIHSKDNIDQFLQDVKDKKEKLMGFGHRVYKNYDPRAKALQKYAHDVINSSKESSKLLEIADILQSKAISDEYFISRKLFPNVDFYSGIVYDTLGIESNLFTCIFAVSRVTGWCAHWCEAVQEQGKIWRPGQVYTGETGKKI